MAQYDGISNNPAQHALAEQLVKSVEKALNARLHIAYGGDPGMWGLDPVATDAADEVWTISPDSLSYPGPRRDGHSVASRRCGRCLPRSIY
jgi:hypothetical protein